MRMARRLCEGALAPWIGAALVLLIVFARKPDAFLNPQLWAEDGSIFFAQQVVLGARAHLVPYAGTFNEVPRFVASAAALLPHLYAPVVYNLAALLVLLALVLKLYSPRLGLACGRSCGLPFALAVALVPHPRGEVFACLANVQWILALLLLLVVLQRSAATRAEALGDALLVLLAGLTGPFVLFALPLLRWKLWRHRSRLDLPALSLPVLGAALGTAAVQLWALLYSSIQAPGPALSAPDVWGRLIGWRLVGGLFLGPELPVRLSPLVLVVAGILVLCGILWTLRRSPEALERAGLALAFAAAVTAASFAKFAAAPSLLIPWGNAARYFFLPGVVVAWCLLLVLTTRQGAPRLLASAALLAILASSLLSAFRSPPLEDRRWAEQARRIGGPEAEIWIPINPEGWRIHISQPTD